ncbi:MAG: hypothetical protein LBR81_06670 [Prevotellaceae bacterium]|nr:hypothetical protein [Prevotellaceae bacterium]
MINIKKIWTYPCLSLFFIARNEAIHSCTKIASSYLLAMMRTQTQLVIARNEAIHSCTEIASSCLLAMTSNGNWKIAFA